jgi:hypothetical protein
LPYLASDQQPVRRDLPLAKVVLALKTVEALHSVLGPLFAHKTTQATYRWIFEGNFVLLVAAWRGSADLG